MRRQAVAALALCCTLLYSCAGQTGTTVQAAPTMAAAAGVMQQAEVLLTPETPAQSTPGVATPSSPPARTASPARTAAPVPAATPYPQPALPTPVPTPTPRPTATARPLRSALPMPLTGMQYVHRALKTAGYPADAAFTVEVTCHLGKLFSCLVHIKGGAGKAEELLPVTVDLDTGKPCELGDFFSREDTGWKSLLPDIVTKLARSRDLTLLCEVPPVTDDQPFYIEDGGIVLVYHVYEITTYDAGTPCFALPMQEIKGYLSGAYGIGG